MWLCTYGEEVLFGGLEYNTFAYLGKRAPGQPISKKNAPKAKTKLPKKRRRPRTRQNSEEDVSDNSLIGATDAYLF